MSNLLKFTLYFREKDELIKSLEAELNKGKNDHDQEISF